MKNNVIFSDSKNALQHLISCTYGGRGIPLSYAILNLQCKINSEKIIDIVQKISARVGI